MIFKVLWLVVLVIMTVLDLWIGTLFKKEAKGKLKLTPRQFRWATYGSGMTVLIFISPDLWKMINGKADNWDLYWLLSAVVMLPICFILGWLVGGRSRNR